MYLVLVDAMDRSKDSDMMYANCSLQFMAALLQQLCNGSYAAETMLQQLCYQHSGYISIVDLILTDRQDNKMKKYYSPMARAEAHANMVD